MAKSKQYITPLLYVTELMQELSLCATSDFTGTAGDDWTYNDIDDEL